MEYWVFSTPSLQYSITPAQPFSTVSGCLSLETIERIALLYLQEAIGELPFALVDEGFTQREAYLEGSLTEPPDVSIYQDPPLPDHE